MGATLSSPSRADLAELDELRRLAYGPGPGIGHDPVAQARLVQLEASVRRATMPPDAAATRPHDEHLPGAASALFDPLTVDSATADRTTTGVATTGVPTTGVATTDVTTTGMAPDTDGQGAPDPSPPHPAPPAGRPRRRRRAVLATGALGLVAAVAAASALTGASLDVTLQPRAEVPAEASAELGRADELDYLGISPADVRLYEEFRGLNIWSGPRGTSSTCMFVTTDARPRWRVDCAPWSGEPTIDLIKYRESSRLSGIEAWGDMPIGSMIRLVLRDGAVVAQTVDAPGFEGSTR